MFTNRFGELRNMSLTKQLRDEIKKFILWNIRSNPSDVVRITQDKFNLSRPAVLRYIHNLEKENQIEIQGITSNRKYSLKPLQKFNKTYQLQGSLAEDKVWRNDILPLVQGIKENVINICQYGFTEILNNAIDHSEGTTIVIDVDVYIDFIDISIIDNGVGIFNKIQKEYHLDDPLHAILELSKGKLTTDPASHTGEGIFFTSRMFDFFAILSGSLRFVYKDLDVCFEEDQDIKGTEILMRISTISERTTTSVFSKFTSDSVEHGFDKTVVPAKLARYGNESLVSRSQAKRLLTRLEKFRVVVLDFDHIDEIGRAFADEIFRVYATSHPNTKILAINDNKRIKRLIVEVQENRD
jgi:anti-sigma regulatory factor (Ser/Thr protein kinase)